MTGEDAERWPRRRTNKTSPNQTNEQSNAEDDDESNPLNLSSWGLLAAILDKYHSRHNNNNALRRRLAREGRQSRRRIRGSGAQSRLYGQLQSLASGGIRRRRLMHYQESQLYDQ